VVKAKEVASPDTIVGDPTVAGASLLLVANGGTPSAQTFALPAGTSALAGRPFWSGDATKGFKYKDSKGENGPLKSAQIKKSSRGRIVLKAVADGRRGSITVLPPDPGLDGCVLLGLNGGDTYSVQFGPGSQITNTGAMLFKATKPTAEGSCVTTTTTTTTT